MSLFKRSSTIDNKSEVVEILKIDNDLSGSMIEQTELSNFNLSESNFPNPYLVHRLVSSEFLGSKFRINNFNDNLQYIHTDGNPSLWIRNAIRKKSKAKTRTSFLSSNFHPITFDIKNSSLKINMEKVEHVISKSDLNSIPDVRQNLPVLPSDPGAVPIGNGLATLFVFSLFYVVRMIRMKRLYLLVLLSVFSIEIYAVHFSSQDEKINSVSTSTDWYTDLMVSEIGANSVKLNLTIYDPYCMGNALMVEWGTANSNEHTAELGAAFCSPNSAEFVFPNLQAATEYKFRVYDTFGLFGYSQEYAFTTLFPNLIVEENQVIEGEMEVNNLIINEGQLLHINAANGLVHGNLILYSNNRTTSILKSSNSIQIEGQTILENTISSGKWQFISCPFDVPLDSISKVVDGAETPVVFGSPIAQEYVSGKDLYIAEYDGFNRDDKAVSAPNTTETGAYWTTLTTSYLVANKGYIIAIDSDFSTDSIVFRFKSLKGANSVLTSEQAIPVQKFTTNSLSINHSWNLIGNPYLYTIDLWNANFHKPYYIHDGIGYKVVIGDESDDLKDRIIKPFSSFFCQAMDESQSVIFTPLVSNAEVPCNPESNAILQIKISESISEKLSESLTGNNLDGGDRYKDVLRIRLGESYAKEFKLGEDALKLQSHSNTVAQIYSVIPNGTILSVNSVPLPADSITIRITFPHPGAFLLEFNGIDENQLFNEYRLLDSFNNQLLELNDLELVVDSILQREFLLVRKADDILSTFLRRQQDLKIESSYGLICFQNIPVNAEIRIYSASGVLLHLMTSTGESFNYAVDCEGICCVKVSSSLGDYLKKIRLYR